MLEQGKGQSLTFLLGAIWPWLSWVRVSRDCKGKEGEGRSPSLDKELAGPGSGAYSPDVRIPPGPGDTVGVGWRSGMGTRWGWRTLREEQNECASDSSGLKPLMSHFQLCDTASNT